MHSDSQDIRSGERYKQEAESITCLKLKEREKQSKYYSGREEREDE